MWASWSGTLETVKLLIRNRADSTVANRNGCTVAHWAASGGNVEVCKYLGSVTGVIADISAQVTDFKLKNGMEVVVIEDHRAPVVVHMVSFIFFCVVPCIVFGAP